MKEVERKALKQGLTFYKEGQGGEPARYYFSDMGKICSVEARHVKIPNMVKGITLSPIEREKLRKGELVTLKDKKGNEFAVRIDVTRRNGLQEYYKDGRSMKSVPSPQSPDEVKLEYIKEKGFGGIHDIYGEKTLNLERDTFLDRFGLKADYMHVRETSIREGNDYRMSPAFQEADNGLRTKAEQELGKITKSNSMRL